MKQKKEFNLVSTVVGLVFLLMFFCLPNHFRAQVEIPYMNYFNEESDLDLWNHYAIEGTDDWVVGEPSLYFSSFSGGGSLVTTLDDYCAQNAERVLESPSFDLSTATEPLRLSFYQRRKFQLLSDVSFFFEYSVDQGSTWELLLSPDEFIQLTRE